MDYIVAFDLAAVCRYPDGQVGVTPQSGQRSGGVVVRDVKAGPIRRLGVAPTDHATVLARAKAAVSRIEAGMARAQRTGVLHEFQPGVPPPAA
jgi:hypothetical protein